MSQGQKKKQTKVTVDRLQTRITLNYAPLCGRCDCIADRTCKMCAHKFLANELALLNAHQCYDIF